MEHSYLKKIIEKLEETQTLTLSEWETLITERTPELAAFLASRAEKMRTLYYGHDVYVRGLIEFTNYCKNDCYYCGIRKSNENVHRYRLTKDDILCCCRTGYDLGFRTFVLQGGEDPWYTDERLADIIRTIKEEYPDCAITLSVGEKPIASYELFYKCGADRYLLRHETYNAAHYHSLHPEPLSAGGRQHCLKELRRIGYQVGSGFMVGSPGQTPTHLAEDMLFLKELNPHMVGIGPFIPHHDTPFAQESAGTLELTLFMLSLLRLMLPKVLLPSTTALGTIASDGRERGILAGANVVMPNLSPTANRKDYSLYDNKICTGDEAAECRHCLEKRMDTIGYHIVTARGDSLVTE